MAIFLTDDELAQLAAMRTAAAQLKQVNPNVIGAFAPIYKWLADLLETKGVTADDQTLLWLRGATEANAGRGAMSALIREYTAKQIKLRYGQEVTVAQMQDASDAVANNLLDDVLGVNVLNGWPKGKVPDIDRIAIADAQAVGEVLFSTLGGLPGRIDSDSAAPNPAGQNSAWSGALLFGLLRSDQAGRLMDHGGAAGAIDTLSDLRDTLYAHRAFAAGLRGATLTSLTTMLAAAAGGLEGAEAAVQLGRDAQTMLQTIAALQTKPDITNTWDQAVVNFTTNAVTRQAFQSITDSTPNRFLDMLYGAREGRAVIGTTTDGSFDGRARELFSQWTSSELKAGGAQLLSAEELRKQASTDVNARAALAGLSFVLLKTKDAEDPALTLFNPVSGDGNLSQYWIDDRAAMLSWLTKAGTPIDGGFVVRGSATGVATFKDWSSGAVFRVNPALLVTREGHDQVAQVFAFGSRDGDSIVGGAYSDRLYGDAGNDTLKGAAGRDRIEGGLGADSIEGDGGTAAALPVGLNDDTLYGGQGNDTLLGGAGNDLILGGSDADELYGDAGFDFLSGGSGADKLHGGAENDLLFDEGGTDTNYLWGDAGNDQLEVKGGTGSFTLDGGLDNDVLRGSQQGSNLLIGGAGNDWLQGGDLDDVLLGDSLPNFGPDGADLIEAGKGNDQLTGGGGADLLRGGEGNDTYLFLESTGFGTDVIEDAQGSNALSFGGKQLGEASYDSDKQAWISAATGLEIRKFEAGGSTTLAISNPADASSTLYLRNWTPGQFGLTLSGEPDEPAKPAVSSVAGTALAGNNYVDVLRNDAGDGGLGNDFVVGSAAKSVLAGGSGNDVVDGRDGDDWLEGGEGDDIVLTGAGKDVAYGGSGNDLMRAGYYFDMVRAIRSDTGGLALFPGQDGWLYTDENTSAQFYYYADAAHTQRVDIAHPELAVFDFNVQRKQEVNPTYTGHMFWSNVGDPAVSLEPGLECQRRSNIDPPCRFNIDPGMDANRLRVGCG